MYRVLEAARSDSAENGLKTNDILELDEIEETATKVSGLSEKGTRIDIVNFDANLILAKPYVVIVY